MTLIRWKFARAPIWIFLLAVGVLQGCAFREAASFGPNFTSIQVGAKRALVDAELGQPRTRVLTTPITTVDIYEYRSNENPSLLRAFSNLLKSFFTLGIWEFWSTERMTLYRLRITYDKQQRVAEIRQVDVFADQLYEEKAAR